MSEKLDDAALFEDTIKGSPVSDRIPAPAKRWRNWYLQLETCKYRSGIIWEKGDIKPGVKVFPSKEVAEQKAIASMEINAKFFGLPEDIVEYIGAFPE